MWIPFADGYGSISSWYQWRSSPVPGSGFGVWKALASSQTRCHFGSIFSGSYRFTETKKPLEGEAVGSSPRPSPPVGLLRLVEQLLPLHRLRSEERRVGKEGRRERP